MHVPTPSWPPSPSAPSRPPSSGPAQTPRHRHLPGQTSRRPTTPAAHHPRSETAARRRPQPPKPTRPRRPLARMEMPPPGTNPPASPTRTPGTQPRPGQLAIGGCAVLEVDGRVVATARFASGSRCRGLLTKSTAIGLRCKPQDAPVRTVSHAAGLAQVPGEQCLPHPPICSVVPRDEGPPAMDGEVIVNEDHVPGVEDDLPHALVDPGNHLAEHVLGHLVPGNCGHEWRVNPKIWLVLITEQDAHPLRRVLELGSASINVEPSHVHFIWADVKAAAP